MDEPKLRWGGSRRTPFLKMKLAITRQGEQKRTGAGVAIVVEASVRGRLAEICAASLRKGQSVAVSGSLRVHQVKAAGGKGHPRLEVIADRVQVAKLVRQTRDGRGS